MVSGHRTPKKGVVYDGQCWSWSGHCPRFAADVGVRVVLDQAFVPGCHPANRGYHRDLWRQVHRKAYFQYYGPKAGAAAD